MKIDSRTLYWILLGLLILLPLKANKVNKLITSPANAGLFYFLDIFNIDETIHLFDE